MNLKKIMPYILVGIFITLLVFYHDSAENERKELFLNSNTTFGTIVDFSGSMGNNYLEYKYYVDNIEYSASKKISNEKVNEELIGDNKLEIEFSIEKPEVSRIIDLRFK